MTTNKKVLLIIHNLETEKTNNWKYWFVEFQLDGNDKKKWLDIGYKVSANVFLKFNDLDCFIIVNFMLLIYFLWCLNYFWWKTARQGQSLDSASIRFPTALATSVRCEKWLWTARLNPRYKLHHLRYNWYWKLLLNDLWRAPATERCKYFHFSALAVLLSDLDLLQNKENFPKQQIIQHWFDLIISFIHLRLLISFKIQKKTHI